MLPRRNLLSFALAGVLGAAVLPASAQPRGHDDRRGPNRGPDRGPRRDPYHPSNDRGRRGPPPHARGVGPDHRWHRGDRLPPAYRHRQYVVNNWRAHRLSAPPRGYNWVQVGGDYALIAVATGLIAQLVLN